MQRAPYFLPIGGPTLYRTNAVPYGGSRSEVECPLIFRKRDQLEQSPNRGRMTLIINLYISMPALLFNWVDCIGELIETDPILSALRSLNATIDSVAYVTCPVHEQV